MQKTPQANRLYELLQRLGRLIRQAEYETGLNPAQWEALCYLARCNKVSNTPSALTAYMGTTKGTISQTLNALERKALIYKQKQSQDPRKVSLHLTKTGRTFIKEHQSKENYSKPLALYTKQQQALIEDAIETILKAQLTKRQGATFGMCKSCAHFCPNHDRTNQNTPHFCQLLNVPLSDKDKEEICAEHLETL